MKNKKTVLAFVLIAVIAVSACAQQGGKSINSAEALKEYIDSQPANTPDKPIKVSMSVNDLMMEKVAKVINSADKYVSLDLSRSVGLTKINDKIFENTMTLVGITIPNSVTNIEDFAFYGCTNLTSINIPNSVTSIGNHAFAFTSLTSVTIPNNVTSISEDAFIFCTNLATINVAAGNSTYASENGVLYNKDKTTLIMYPAGKTGSSFTIPNSVTSIVGGAFSGGCASLTSVTFDGTIPSSGFIAYTFLTGDLRDKFYATDKANGTPGTYTRASGDSKTWTRR